jgi:hypothetical protein
MGQIGGKALGGAGSLMASGTAVSRGAMGQPGLVPEDLAPFIEALGAGEHSRGGLVAPAEELEKEHPRK